MASSYQMMAHFINSCHVPCDLTCSAQENGNLFGKQMALSRGSATLLAKWQGISSAFIAFPPFFLQ